MKTPNLDYRRLADQLVDRGMIPKASMQHVLQECNNNGSLMPEVLVTEGLISDLELSRVCTELFHLPFVPMECYKPADDAVGDLDREYLRRFGLVPLDRFGKLMTISMPGIVPTSVLDNITEDDSICILPVVGTVKGNRRWLKDHLPSAESTTMEAFSAEILDDESSWGNLFDEGDESVKMNLQDLESSSIASDLDLDLSSLDLDEIDELDEVEAPEADLKQPGSDEKEEDLFDLDAFDDLDEAI